MAFVLAPALPAFAWGSEGHRIVAHLAYERLTPRARARVDGLIAHSAEQQTPSCPVASLDDAATWPDCVRPDHRFDYLAADHYEDVPLCKPSGDRWVKVVVSADDPAPLATTEAALSYCRGGKCILAETARAEAILKDRNRSPVERLQALEEIAHFIGDMHQPLHAADNNDRGGNEVKVTVNGYPTNLHHVWDTSVVTRAVGADEAAAEAALRPLVAENASAWASGDLRTWLMETHGLAVSYVYPKLDRPSACNQAAPPQQISKAYLDGAAPIVRQQLARASIRLAKVLNEDLN